MDLLTNGYIIVFGFLVWALIAPQRGKPNYRESFLAYMTALLFCLLASADLMFIKPVAFFFTVGGSLAFFYVVARATYSFSLKNKE